MRYKKYLTLALVSLCVVLGGALLSQQKVAADGENCAVLATEQAAPNCDPGGGSQDYNTCTILDRSDISGNQNLGDNCINAYGSGNPGDSSTKYEGDLKTDFINNLNYYANSGQRFQKIDAAWIENKLDGGDSSKDWQSRINNPNVILEVQQFSFSLNTEYVPTSDTTGYVNQYADAGYNLWSIVIYYQDPQSGVQTEEFAIKLDCGNPVGTLHAIPEPGPQTIGGLVYSADSSGNITDLPGVDINKGFSLGGGPRPGSNNTGPCNIANGKTGSTTSGFGVAFNYQYQLKGAFCITVAPSVTTSAGTYTNPVITPGYVGNPSGSPGSCDPASLDGDTDYIYQYAAGDSLDAAGQGSPPYSNGCSYNNISETNAAYSYNFDYTTFTPTSVAVSGKVYYLDSNGNYHGIDGVSFNNTCTVSVNPTSGKATNNTAGDFHFTTSVGTNFCLTPPSSVKDSANGNTYSNPEVTPDNLSGTLVKPTPRASCSFSGYDKQVANNPTSAGACHYHLSDNSGYNIVYTTVTPPPTITYSCGNENPSSATPGSNINLSTTIIGTSTGGLKPDNNGGTYTIGVSGGLLPANTIGYKVSGSASPYSISNTSLVVPAGNTTGIYTVSWSYSDSKGNSPTCRAPLTVQKEPYLKVYGGDVMAGVKFANQEGSVSSCPTNPYQSNSGIYSWDNEDGSSYVGASTEQGAFATSMVNGFGSANNTTSPGNPGLPNDLTFANSGSNGYFGYAYCIPDYYQQFSDLGGSSVLTATSAKDKLSDFISGGTYSGKTIILAKNIPFYIDVNTNFPATVSPTSNLSSLPYLYVVDKGGNIYISNNVTSMAGVYIAQPKNGANSVTNASVDGNIYDCNTSSANTSYDPDPFNDCRSELVVYGSFIASNIDFQRTNTVTSEDDSGNCTSPDAGAAEDFCYSPLIWLANPFSASSSVTTDYISSVPPTL